MSVRQSLAHAQRMADATHKPECASPPERNRFGQQRPDPTCPGCVTDREREQWRAQAAELKAYLACTVDAEIHDQAQEV